MVTFLAYSYRIIDSLRHDEAEIPMRDFLDTSAGKFLTERSVFPPRIKRVHDYEEDSYIFSLFARLTKEDYLIYKLRYE